MNNNQKNNFNNYVGDFKYPTSRNFNDEGNYKTHVSSDFREYKDENIYVAPQRRYSPFDAYQEKLECHNYDGIAENKEKTFDKIPFIERYAMATAKNPEIIDPSMIFLEWVLYGLGGVFLLCILFLGDCFLDNGVIIAFVVGIGVTFIEYLIILTKSYGSFDSDRQFNSKVYIFFLNWMIMGSLINAGSIMVSNVYLDFHKPVKRQALVINWKCTDIPVGRNIKKNYYLIVSSWKENQKSIYVPVPQKVYENHHSSIRLVTKPGLFGLDYRVPFEEIK